ncbi:hypothetical protein N7470_004332 [Penicillium chermesinum]|nr:hypothetical protein N7470_004332 [Penicillium chermesinum]
MTRTLSLTGESLVDSSPRIRRRKALSRWPPYGLDYGISRGIWSGPRFGVKRLEVTLPWIRLLTDDVVPGATLSDHGSEGAKRKDAHSRPSVLAQQGEEMVSVLRRACFWGQEKGVGERRVTLSRTHANPADEAGRWFDGIWDKPTNDDDY